MNRGIARKLGSNESMMATYRTMFPGISDSDASGLIKAFRSKDQYQQRLEEAKRKYQYRDLSLAFEDGLPVWE